MRKGYPHFQTMWVWEGIGRDPILDMDMGMDTGLCKFSHFLPFAI
jgi:hypothetical protein